MENRSPLGLQASPKFQHSSFKIFSNGTWFCIFAIYDQVAWNYYESVNNTSKSFTDEEQESWNAQKKALADKNKA